jgi:ribonuclease HI
MSSIISPESSRVDPSRVDPSRVQFYKRRNKESGGEKIENIQAWILNDGNLWSFIYINNKKEVFSLCGRENTIDKLKNQLHPLIELLEWIDDPEKKKNVTIYTRSLYIVNCLTEWCDKWRRNNFKIDDNTDRPNADLLRKIDILKTNLSLNVKFLISENDFFKQLKELLTTYNV